MPLVDTINYETKRIYLHADTMNANLDTIGVYREVRALRRGTEGHRNFLPIIVAGGNIAKITGLTYTAAFVQLLYGCRIVPCDQADHTIRLTRDTFTDDGFAGRDCFDRSGLSHKVDIDVDFPEIEVRQISGGSGLSSEEHDKLMALSSIDPWSGNIAGYTDKTKFGGFIQSVLKLLKGEI